MDYGTLNIVSFFFQGTLAGHTDYIQCLCLRPKHQQCVSGSEDGTVRLWGKELVLITPEAYNLEASDNTYKH